MTGSLRSTARNPIAVALMGVLVLVFLILGIGGGGGRFPDAFRGIDANAVVVAGSHTVSPHEFKLSFDSRKQEIDQQQGQPIPVSVLAESGLDQQMLTQLAAEQSELEMLHRVGVVPSDVLVDGEIKKQPGAFDPVTGKFSQDRFSAMLAQQGFTPADALRLIRDGLAHRHFAAAAEYGFHAPRLYSALFAVEELENRDVTYFVMDQHAVPMPTPPTDAQLLAFMKEHVADLTVPETRMITLVRFSAKALEPSITLDPAAVEKEFEFKKDSLSTPETRFVIEIPVKTAAEGAQVAARLGKGEDPTAVAKSVGAGPIVYADKPLSAIADHKIGVAAFALSQGQVSVVQGDLGIGVVAIQKVTPGKIATLQSGRAQIEADLRSRGARDKASDMSGKFQDARDAGASIADAARKAGATAITIGPVTAQGQDLDGKPNALLNDKILKAAFAEAAGPQGTDVETADPGESFALTVDKVIPPALPPLEQKRAILTQAYMRETLINALKAKADALMASIRKGGSMEAAAAQVNGHVSHQVGLQRIQAKSYMPTLGREMLENVFGVKPGDVFATGGPGGIFIAKLDAVRPGDTTQMARLVQQIGPKLSQQYLGDVETSLRTAANDAIKPRTNLTAARLAINLDQATIDKLNAKAKGPDTKGAKPAAKLAP
ncbi:MAG TPA: SurA N-terminal domain-containing protein [Caulobacteraceae bacterium]